MSAAAAIRVVHDRVPGRVRLHVPLVQRRPRTAERLRLALEQEPAVAAVQVSPVTGNVLVQFAPGQSSAQRLAAFIRDWAARHTRVPAAPVSPLPAAEGAAPSMPATAPEPAAGDLPARDRLRDAASRTAEQVLAKLGVSPDAGLSTEQVRKRSTTAGRQERGYRRSAAQILREQFVSVPTGLLASAMALSFFTAGKVEALVIGAVLLLNGLIGYATERYSEGAIEALRKLGYPQARVIREGERRTVPAADLVEGDMIRLRAGDVVPADARLTEGSVLVDEAMLTGESEPVGKNADRTAPPRHLHEFSNVLFKGTSVVDGRARAAVLATADDTELGRIQSLVREVSPPRTQLQEQLDGLGKVLGVGAGSASAALFGLGLWRGHPLLQTAQTAVSLAVSAVPEGLPAIATSALAVGMNRMLGRKVVIRRLPAVEALGSVTTLCVDKTGTLTLNRMTASCFWYEGATIRYENGGAPGTGHFVDEGGARVDPRRHRGLQEMLEVGVLCNDAKLRRENGRLHVSGSATEGALLMAAQAGGYSFEQVRASKPLLTAHRRNEERSRMATVHQDGPGHILVAVKGQPDAVLELCSHRPGADGEPVRLTEEDRERYRQANHSLTAQGLRVLAFARRRASAEALHNGHLEGLTWIGLVGLEDPIRSGVADAIERCARAGVRTVILTGDQPGTALAVARALRLNHGRADVVDASDFERMTPDEIARTVDRTGVYARISPEHKLRIVQALQQRGHVVAMTGDGINDGPALKAADIGIAMGEGSSDVARELADVVLTGNDFHAIVAAVEQGRVIFANIRRSLRYLMATNVSELFLAATTLAAGVPFPLRPIQILWLNLVSDVFPALALVLEPQDRDVMRQPPRKPGTPILSRAEGGVLCVDAAAFVIAVLAAYLWAARRTGFGAVAGTVAWTALTVGETLYALTCSGTAEGRERLQHGTLWASVGGAIGLQVAANRSGLLRRVLGAAPLGAREWAVSLAAAVAPAAWAALRHAVWPGWGHALLPGKALTVSAV